MGTSAETSPHTGASTGGAEAELALIRQLAEVTRRLVGELSVNEVIRTVAQAGLDLLHADAAVIALTEDGTSYANAVSIGVDEHLHEHAIVAGEGLHGQVLDRRAPIVLDDYDTWDDAIPTFVGIGFHAAVAVPIPAFDTLVGVLSVHHRAPDARVSEEEVSVLSLLAEHAGSAIVRARSHRALTRERQRFLALLETLPDGLAVIEHGIVTAWNRGAEQLTGRLASDVVGHPPPLELTTEARMAVDGGGEQRWVDAVVSTLDADGAHAEVWLLRDVTEQERLEQARNLFLATTSHELKTPLTVVKGLSITLRRNWDRMREDQRTEALETIERRTYHLDRLVERVLVGSRVEAGVMDFHITPVDLTATVADVLEGFTAIAPLHDLRTDVADHFPLVAADRQALDTVLGHIVDNAVKYSPKGGEIVLSADEDGPWARVTVADRGEGIAGELQDLLKPFAQGDRHTTRRIAGVGIGLYIVSRLVAGMGGELSAVNRPDGGAAFSFTLPVWGRTDT